MIVRTTLFIGAVENLEVVVVDIFTGKGIGNEFQDRRLSDTGLSNKKDCVLLIRTVFRCFDNSLLERLYVTIKYR